MSIQAFVGHSFAKEDEVVVQSILDHLNTIKKAIPSFDWDHAKEAELKDLKKKVLDKIEGKNLFIGICTAKECVVSPGDLLTSWFSTKFLKVRRTSIERKTSDWVIQEIGLAVGREMKIILMIEEGVRAPGALQGNLEYISFNRQNPAEALRSLLEMISSLTIQKEATSSEDKKSLETTDAAGVGEILSPAPASTNRSDWTWSDYVGEMVGHVFDGDFKKADEILQDGVAKFAGKDDQANELRAARLSSESFKHGSNVLDKLKQVEIESPKSTYIKERIANIYERYGQTDQSIALYDEIYRKAEPGEEKLKSGRILASKLIDQNEFGLAETVVWTILKTPVSDKKAQANILRTAAKFAKSQKQFLLYFALGEQVLYLAPDDDRFRFELAHVYGDQSIHATAIKHYLILTKRTNTGGDWNNLGVGYANLGLMGLAVEAYEAARALGNHNASSNIAGRLLNAGFTGEAEKICEAALQSDNDETNLIISTLESIRSLRVSETEKQAAELLNAKNLAEALRKAGALATSTQLEDGTYSAVRSKENFEFDLVGGCLRSQSSFMSKPGTLSSLYGTKPEEMEITLKGKLLGRVGYLTRIEATVDSKREIVKEEFLVAIPNDSELLLWKNGESAPKSFALSKKAPVTIND